MFLFNYRDLSWNNTIEEDTMVTQTSLLVGKWSMYGPLSRTPLQHPVHGLVDLFGCFCPIVAGCNGAHIIVQGPNNVDPTGCVPIHFF